MCLLAVLWRVMDDSPLMVAANREEAYTRGGTPPQVVEGDVGFVAGLDPQAGGTWFGVNQHGVLVAVTNRRKTDLPASPRSRGLLARDLLCCRSAQEAIGHATQELGKNLYSGCNLLVADVNSLHVIHAGDWLRVRPLSPGIHVLATGELNDRTDRRIAYALEWLDARTCTVAADWLPALMELCGYNGADGGPPICLHGDKGGTVSSSLFVLRQPLHKSSYWHAQGPPDRTPYQDCTHLLHSWV